MTNGNAAEDMPSSYRKINYALRPAKHTERRMLCDIFRRLSVFNSLTKYAYIGFGGIEFSDFTLFHKALAIRKMTSIERSGPIKRVEDNKPFNSITVIHGIASAVLPNIDWATPNILWLDYDGQLQTEMFADVSIVASRAISGTALAFSFQCEAAPETAQDDTGGLAPLEKFESVFSRERVPNDIEEEDLYGWKYGDLGGKMLTTEIESTLAERNIGVPKDDQIFFHKICTIQYQDNAKMYTVVGVFVANKDKPTVELCEFSTLDFMPANKKIKIDVPLLTLREIRGLEKQLPLHAGESLKVGAIPTTEAQAFAKLYRYLPNFSVLET